MDFGIVVGIHGAEFHALEACAKLAEAFLLINHRPLGGQLNQGHDRREQWRQHQEKCPASNNIDRAFDD